MEFLFPHNMIRPVQSDLMAVIGKALREGTHLVVQAPTGLGKTAAVLSAALPYAMENDRTVFFLTSRHTQHHIAIYTLQAMKKKFQMNLPVVDLIGKQWMCAQSVSGLRSGEFFDYCRKLREHGECEYYLNTKQNGKVTPQAQVMLREVEQLSPSHTEAFVALAAKEKLCPYELAALLGKKASVIIADYNYIFHPGIRASLLGRLDKKLEDCIIIVDEAHNLPARIRETMTVKLTSFILDRALKEAQKFNLNEVVEMVQTMSFRLQELAKEMHEERLVTKDDFSIDYDEAQLEEAADAVMEEQKQSFLSSVSSFLEAWRGKDPGHARILSKERDQLTLAYRCLDPSLVSSAIADEAQILAMSGTLTPTFMYKDILGLRGAVEKEFQSPFPAENKLSLIIPKTTTKYTRRTKEEYQKIAALLSTITDAVPGNSAVFFPSYQVRDEVHKYLFDQNSKTLFLEKPGMTKEEKKVFLEKFKSYSDEGAVLMGVAAGSYGEGIDLPGALLKAVIVVGLPLEKPNLQTKQLIAYYDQKYSRGWEYGYIFPAIQKVLQNAGRCIRSETDRGLIVFLDERFAWPQYRKCIPQDFKAEISLQFRERIEEFFE